MEIHLRTVGDLGNNHVIVALCGPCGRSVQLNTAKLRAVHGASLTLDDLRRRLTCRECRRRTRDIRIVFALPPR